MKLKQGYWILKVIKNDLLYSNKVVFLDLVKEMLKAPWAKNLKEENLVLVDKECILSDFQSTVDYRMPLRLFFYINEILREYAKNLNKKGFNVPAVIPIVLYNATRKWNAPRYFKEIVNKSELFGDNIVNFKYELFDVNHLNDENLEEEVITMTKTLYDPEVKKR